MDAVTKVVALLDAAKAAVVAKLAEIDALAQDTDTGVGAFTTFVAHEDVIW